MRARLTRHPLVLVPHPSPSFIRVRGSCATVVLLFSLLARRSPPRFAFSVAHSLYLSLSCFPPLLYLLLSLPLFIFLFLCLSLVAPPVPFASGDDIYTRINPAARTRVPTYIAAGPGHLVISVTSRTFRSERQLTCNCGANGCSRMRRA